MRIYVASSWRNLMQQGVVHTLRAAGHEVYDFKKPVPGNDGFHWSEIDPEWRGWQAEKFRTALDHPVAKAGFALDMGALEAVDVCVLVLPCGRSAHLEAGWALGAGKPCLILLDEQNEPELMYRMAGTENLCASLVEVLERLEALEAGHA
jgi:hypothetical protein